MYKRPLLHRLIIIAMLAGLAGLASCDNGQSESELLQSAQKYYDNHKLRAAAIQLKNILQESPKNAEARYLLGKLDYELGDYASAEKEFERSLHSGWSPEEATIGMMRAMVMQKKFGDVIKLKPETNGWSKTGQANALAIKALAQANSHDVVAAKNTILLTDKLDPDAFDVLKTTLILQVEEKHLDNARVTLGKALKLFPGNTELLLISARLASVANDKALEADSFDKVIATGADDVMTMNVRNAYIGRLKVAVQNNNHEKVAEIRKVFTDKKLDVPEADYLFAVSAYQQKKYDLAEEDLQKILKITSTHGPTLLLSGMVSFAKQDFEQAAYYLSRYVANQPANKRARKLLGRAYMALGQYDEAEQEFSFALGANTDDAELIALRGLSEIGGGETKSGIEGLEKALKLAPDSASLKFELAKAYVGADRIDDAIALVDSISGDDANAKKAAKIKVIAYLKARQYQLAINTARQILDESPNDVVAINLLGSVYLASGDHKQARAYYEKALQASSGNKTALMSLARLDEEADDTASAENRYREVLNHDDKYVLAMNALARIAGEKGDIDKQVKWLEAARKADPNEITARVKLIEIYLGRDKVDLADQILEELENTHPEAAPVLAAKARVLMAKHLYTQAQNAIVKLVSTVPDSDIAYYIKAQNEQALGELKAALESIRKAYSINKSSSRNRVYLAQLENLNKHYDKARVIADSIIKQHPEATVGYMLKGKAMLGLQQYQAALNVYDKAQSIKSDGLVALGRYRAIRGMKGIKAAMPVLLDWLEKDPKDGAVAAELATAYMLMDNYDKAIEYFDRSIKVQPDNVIALNNLAYLYLLRGDPQANEYAERAYRLAPDELGVLDTYGWVLVKEGSYERALSLLTKVANALPGNPEIQYHYAKALYLNGEKDQARKLLRTIVNKGVKFNGLDDARAMLDQ